MEIISTLWDKVGDFVVCIFIAIAGWFGRRMYTIDKRFNSIELDLAKNYVTQNEFSTLEVKIDHNNELLNSKIDTINSNILLLVRDKVSG